MVVLLTSEPALAQTFGGWGGDVHGGVGGSGGGVGGGLGLPGAPGTTPPTIEGANGGGGGGGGGAGGGAGGAGAASEAGAPGGGPGTDGSSACCAANNGGGGGGGGNGGAHGATTADPVIDITTPLSGMAGGAGGKGGTANGASSFGGGGGGGGAGGYGLVVTGASAISNTSTITGGAGGAGGNGGNATLDGGDGGWGGSGGIGVYITVPGATLTNSGTIQGGTGGLAGLGGTGTAANGNDGVYSDGGAGVWVVGSGTITTIVNTGTIAGGNFGNFGGLNSNGSSASGGDGISGADLVVINSGTIAGGIGANSVQTFQANAVTFTGGTNTLELQAGYNFVGNVVAFSPADTFRLGGASNAQFDASQIGATAQYRGFGVFELNATADTTTWKLINTPGQATPWNLVKGVLSVGASDNLGPEATSPLTFSGGTLQVTGTTFTDFGGRTINWGANGGGLDIADKSNTFTVSEQLTGTGGLWVGSLGGPGTVKLTAVNTYAGPTNIYAGALLVDGSIASMTTVHAGGTLGGTGTIFNGVDNYGNVAPGNSIGDLTITGAYVGFGGTLTIEAVLAGNGSPIDHLILSGATASASGTTGIVVVNLPGSTGAQTTGNGIPVVVAENGATSTASAFHLAGPVGAGPFQYLLFRGPQAAGAADDQNSWYLRSHTTANAGGGGGNGGGGGGNGGGGGGGGGGPGPEIPLYRPETASYALFPALARGLAVSTIGTFHERNGDQALAGGSKRERLWGRIFGEHSERSHGGHVTPSFEGHAAGFQAGADVYETMWDNGVRGRAGVFVGWAEARGDIKGFVLGNLEAFAGDAQLEATSVGGYGTLVGPGGWYVDGIVMPSFYSGDGRSTNGIGVNADGWSLLGSLEAGIPFRLGGGFTLEPQAQLIYQHLDFDDAADPFSTVRFNTPDAVSGRIGVRLAADFAGGRWRPYLKANIWQDWLDKDGIIYAGTHRLDTEHGGTALEVGGGLVAELMPGVGLWGVVDYTTDIAGDTERETLRGNAGVRITW